MATIGVIKVKPLQGESKKMSVSEKGSLITNGHFFDSPSILITKLVKHLSDS